MLEETGYDMSHLLDPNAFVEVFFDGKKHKLYIVSGLDPETTAFAPQAKFVSARPSTLRPLLRPRYLPPQPPTPNAPRRNVSPFGPAAPRPPCNSPACAVAAPHVRCASHDLPQEIGAYAWHRVWELPSTRAESDQTYTTEEGKRHSFYAVWPFIKPLRRWIKQKRSGGAQPVGSGKGRAKAAPGAGTQQQQQQQQVGKQQQATKGAAAAPVAASTPPPPVASSSTGSAQPLASTRSPSSSSMQQLMAQASPFSYQALMPPTAPSSSLPTTPATLQPRPSAAAAAAPSSSHAAPVMPMMSSGSAAASGVVGLAPHLAAGQATGMALRPPQSSGSSMPAAWAAFRLDRAAIMQSFPVL